MEAEPCPEISVSTVECPKMARISVPSAPKKKREKKEKWGETRNLSLNGRVPKDGEDFGDERQVDTRALGTALFVRGALGPELGVPRLPHLQTKHAKKHKKK